MIEGVDVSEFNPTVPWAGIAPAFAFVRLTSGLRADVSGSAHLNNAHGAGVELLGAYAWLRADASGLAQARMFLAAVAREEALYGPLALALDVEHRNKPAEPWPLPELRREVLAFLETLRAAGRVCAVYGPRMLLASLDLPAWVRRLPFWAASKPPAPTPWGAVDVQQTGVVTGIDRNTFFGSADDWRRLFELAPLTRAAALARALDELDVTEQQTERVREYLAGCQRGGVPLVLPDGAEWCAAFACWSGMVRPKRCAVWELVEDARAAGTLRAVGAYWPAPGDLAVYARAGETPLNKGERGHITRVIKAQGQEVIDISGNSGDAADRVARKVRKVADVLAWIEVAR